MGAIPEPRSIVQGAAGDLAAKLDEGPLVKGGRRRHGPWRSMPDTESTCDHQPQEKGNSSMPKPGIASSLSIIRFECARSLSLSHAAPPRVLVRTIFGPFPGIRPGDHSSPYQERCGRQGGISAASCHWIVPASTASRLSRPPDRAIDIPALVEHRYHCHVNAMLLHGLGMPQTGDDTSICPSIPSRVRHGMVIPGSQPEAI
ncbi:hypothetical protein ACCO45_001831 [Purpureocillium lilacinum]|uniref:Uncharacterized protein n=1 Tax=Purpureocillium lilacinum TaxID=33203 RepID=A0ACC4E9A2_PURLI